MASTTRKSVVTKSDCIVLTRKMHEAQQKMISYVSEGCRETGFSDDFMLCVSLLDLKHWIDDILAKRPKHESNAN